MQVSEYDLDQRQGRRVPSPGCCIYCRTSSAGLTDEHVVPYALGAHTLVLEGSCCPACQEIIQPYEQEVLRRQLGVFRAQVDAPTRNKKDRPSSVRMHFVEVGDDGTVLRDLGYRPVPLEEVPLSLNLGPLLIGLSRARLGALETLACEQMWSHMEMNFADDDEMQLLVMGIQDGLRGQELEAAVGVDTKRLATLRTRFKRELDKYIAARSAEERTVA